MTIHVNIGEATTRLPELVAAARRGEEVVVSEPGEPQVRLVAVAQDGLVQVADDSEAERERRRALRKSAFGMYSHLIDGRDIVVRDLRMTDADWEERYRRKFGPPD